MLDHEPIPYELTDDSRLYPVDSTATTGVGATTAPGSLLVDYSPARDIDRVANNAIDIAERIRHVDPHRLYGELVELCRMEPAKAAQILMAFAAWFDLDISTNELQIRAEQTAAEQIYQTTVASR